MKKKRTLFLLFALFAFSSFIQAQEVDLNKVFEEFQQQQQQEFNNFKNKADEEFSAFLRETWEKFEVKEPIPAPLRPEPVEPTVFDDKTPAPAPVQVKPRKPASTTPTRPTPGKYVSDEPYVPVKIDKPVVPPSPNHPVDRTAIRLYGTSFYISTNAISRFSLKGIGEGNVADAWSALCKADHELLINDCMTLKEEKRLSDWGYIQLTRQIGEQLYGARRTNDIAFLQMFILSKSGYKVRLAKINEQLKLLIAPSGIMYGLPYITLSSTKFYVVEPLKQSGGSIYTYPQEFANARNYVSLFLHAVPGFDHVSYTRELNARNGLSVQTVVNKNLIDFYKDYPLCGVPPHYKAPMSDELCQSLYPPLRAAIQGKLQKEAANILINFVQTAFDYKTDGEQFGYEKPNFPEENFYYPYNDCEDRAMLYATLVKDMLGLEVVLLDYPGHIASAVCFTEDIPGDNVLIDGRKYLICDPTYIGASIGMCMSEYRNIMPTIIK
ncbi:hypothetical protein [Bacteroides sp. 51]|uniref:hypothetical protein n=1 Tax=Bacteroides sp. 51 TaxID=2302938 RepID=UPI0013D7761F|nr:hypothetical protein [Bacteroides sp. 51]NDV84876.1 hypothetical protein [Bacteroides sp. 51]